MPVEYTGFSLVPFGFFDRNPALDVPPVDALRCLSPRSTTSPSRSTSRRSSALSEEGVPVIGARIAERLGRSAPSVSQMLDRLVEDGYVTRDRPPPVADRAAGGALGEKVVRKHRLAERLLVDVIGLEWHKVHREAGRWEHVISDDVEARLVELLGDPATCPHGNPIPGSRSPGAHVGDETAGRRGRGGAGPALAHQRGSGAQPGFAGAARRRAASSPAPLPASAAATTRATWRWRWRALPRSACSRELSDRLFVGVP